MSEDFYSWEAPDGTRFWVGIDLARGGSDVSCRQVFRENGDGTFTQVSVEFLEPIHTEPTDAP